MDDTNLRSASKNRFIKLSLKKHKPNLSQGKKKNRNSDVIIIDESMGHLRNSDQSRNVMPTMKISSPIVINDSYDVQSDVEIPQITISSSFSLTPEIKQAETKNEVSGFCTPLFQKPNNLVTTNRPSKEGWSPVQNIICATPNHQTTPSRPRELANESMEECSMKKILSSQQKLLNELYGEAWKSIPTLSKARPHQWTGTIEAKKLNFTDDETDENITCNDTKMLPNVYLTGSDVKHRTKLIHGNRTAPRAKKKLYTEKIPNTPEPTAKKLKRDVKSTTKKAKYKSVTELVELIDSDVSQLIKKPNDSHVKSASTQTIRKISFMGSLADNVPTWRCDPEALTFKENFKSMREQLTRKLFVDFNKIVFSDGLEHDMPVIWDGKLRTTAGTTTNRLIKNSKGDRIRRSCIKLSTKVIDGPQRLRDTLVHEMCHAATWILDNELRAGHGPLWKKWATKALQNIPELVEISRCHELEIHFKYSYKCTKCGYRINRHSKSIDTMKKCCGYCCGTFQLIVNKKTKDGLVISTPARKGEPNDFAKYVKENYASIKNGTKSHTQVMKELGLQFSAKKTKNSEIAT